MLINTICSNLIKYHFIRFPCDIDNHKHTKLTTFIKTKHKRKDNILSGALLTTIKIIAINTSTRNGSAPHIYDLYSDIALRVVVVVIAFRPEAQQSTDLKQIKSEMRIHHKSKVVAPFLNWITVLCRSCGDWFNSTHKICCRHWMCGFRCLASGKARMKYT